LLHFGKNSLLTSDLYHQYGPLLNEFVDRVKENNSLFFSFNAGLGIPFFRNFFNYLSSPLNIILFLFDQNHILIAFSVIIGLKACIASTTLAYYLKKTFNQNNISICLFGVLYGFSSYFLAFYWNIMWLDGFMLLPIICLGINKLIKDNKILLYIISLFITLFANYFIGYMICIFSVLYFFAYLVITNTFNIKLYFKKCLLFAFSSLIAGALCAFFIIPMFFALKTISATSDKFVFSFYFNFNILYLIPNSLYGVIPTIFFTRSLSTPIPNIACGLIPLISCIAIFFNKDISLKIKIVFSTLLSILIFSFIFKPLDFIWHGFHNPNDLPYRYSFIYIFIVIIFGYFSFLKLKEVKTKFIISIVVFYFAAAIIFYMLNYINNSYKHIIFILATIFIYLIMYYLYVNNSLSKAKLEILLTFIVCAEIIIGININWNINHNIEDFMNKYRKYRQTFANIKENDPNFYRSEFNTLITLNDASLYNYNGISTFTSVAYQDMAKLMKSVGLAGNSINSYYYIPNTPVFDMIFSLKYTIGNRAENSLYTLKDINSVPVYEFNYALSPLFAISKDASSFTLSDNPFQVQEDFIDKSTGVKDTFIKLTDFKIYDKLRNNCNYDGTYIKLEKYTEKLTIELTNDSNTYLYLSNENINYFTVNDTRYDIPKGQPFILDCGKFDKKIIINIYLAENTTIVDPFIKFYAYKIDESKFLEAYNILKNYELQIKSFNDTKITGTIEVSEDKLMFTSIAHDNGWKVFVDGKQVQTLKLADALLCFPIEKGFHEIELIYRPFGLEIGILITLISSVILVIFLILNKKLKFLK